MLFPRERSIMWLVKANQFQTKHHKEGRIVMWKYTVQVDGMMCGMCESHTNDAIRKAFNVKKVTSSHTKKETVIVCEDELDEQEIRNALAPTGYDVGTNTKAPYKKGFFGLFG